MPAIDSKGRKQLSRWLGRVHQILGRRKWSVAVALKIRNQCNRVISYYLGNTADFDINGEGWLLKQMAPHVHTFVDIGANFGDWTAQLLSLTSAQVRGLCFEPAPGILDKLRSRFRSEPRVEVLGAAVGDKDGTIVFHENILSPELSGAFGNCAGASAGTIEYPVPLTRLDQEIGSRRLEPRRPLED